MFQLSWQQRNAGVSAISQPRRSFSEQFLERWGLIHELEIGKERDSGQRFGSAKKLGALIGFSSLGRSAITPFFPASAIFSLAVFANRVLDHSWTTLNCCSTCSNPEGLNRGKGI
jgi:hypothetical protein